MVYTCADCEREFTIYSTYYSHRSRTHKAPTKKCNFCEKMYYTNAEVYRHMWLCQTKHKSVSLGINNVPSTVKNVPSTGPTLLSKNSLISPMFR